MAIFISFPDTGRTDSPRQETDSAAAASHLVSNSHDCVENRDLEAWGDRNNLGR